MSTLPGPFAIPNDSTTPYKVTFDRLMRALADLQFQADVLAENRAAGAVFDGIPFLLSMDSAERFLSIRAVWDTDFDAETAGHPLFAAADSWNREKYFPTVYWMLDPEGSLRRIVRSAIDRPPGSRYFHGYRRNPLHARGSDSDSWVERSRKCSLYTV